MEIDFSKLFHHSSKNHSLGQKHTPTDEGEWPEEWKTTYYKTYPRLPKIDLHDYLAGGALELSGDSKTNLFKLISTRSSKRNFARGSVSIKELSLLLKFSCGNMGPMHNDRYRRAQPSGGARFPIEVYPIVFRSNEELKAGLYHYNVKDHALDTLWSREFNDHDISELFMYPWSKDASIAVVMTSIFWRNQNKYNERGYRCSLLEAGHIGQNIYLVCEALGLKCCALSGTRDRNLEKLIDIDGTTESVVYALVVGK